MVGDNNGAYSPPLLGDPRDISMMKSGEPAGLVIMSMPKTRPDAYTSQVALDGDVNEAQKYVPLVTQQMVQMHQQNVNNLEIVNRPVDLGGGKKIECSRNFTADNARIYVPKNPNPKGLGPLHLNFDPSVQTEFAQTLFDKNHGMPFYFHVFDGMDLNVSGVTATADGYASGYIYFDPKETAGDEKTMLFALSLAQPFESPDGTAALYSTFTGPASWMSLSASYYATGYPASASLDLALPEDTPGVVTISGLSSSHNTILGVRTKSYDISYNEGGASTFNIVSELFVDGEKVAEAEGNKTGWGSSYGDARSQMFTAIEGPGNSSATIKQKMLYGSHFSDSQMGEVTDKLAAKWGF